VTGVSRAFGVRVAVFVVSSYVTPAATATPSGPLSVYEEVVIVVGSMPRLNTAFTAPVREAKVAPPRASSTSRWRIDGQRRELERVAACERRPVGAPDRRVEVGRVDIEFSISGMSGVNVAVFVAAS